MTRLKQWTIVFVRVVILVSFLLMIMAVVGWVGLTFGIIWGLTAGVLAIAACFATAMTTDII